MRGCCSDGGAVRNASTMCAAHGEVLRLLAARAAFKVPTVKGMKKETFKSTQLYLKYGAVRFARAPKTKESKILRACK